VDLDGDGIDEVVVVSLVRNSSQISITKWVYSNEGFTAINASPITYPEPIADILPEIDSSRSNTNKAVGHKLALGGWSLIAADLNGDGKQECVLTLPGKTTGGRMYILDNNLNKSREVNVKDTYGLTLPSGGTHLFSMVSAADYDQDGKDELCLMGLVL
jgi:hypothetical protein